MYTYKYERRSIVYSEEIICFITYFQVLEFLTRGIYMYTYIHNILKKKIDNRMTIHFS